MLQMICSRLILVNIFHVFCDISTVFEQFAALRASAHFKAVRYALVLREGMIVFERGLTPLNVASERSLLRQGQFQVLDGVLL